MADPQVFISYKRDDVASREIIDTLQNELDNCDLVFDEDIEVSERWDLELYKWVLNCDAAIILINKDAVKSDWCRREWAVLAARWGVASLPVIPVFIDEIIETGILDSIEACSTTDTSFIQKLKDKLQDVSSSKMTAWDYLAAHQGWIKYQFNGAPVFNREPYALKDVYIEPECGQLPWLDIKEHKKDPFKESSECGGRQELLKTVFDLMGDPDFSDLITIQAGPGAGKSAFTLHLADELLEQEMLPVVVKFRDLRLSTKDTVEELIDDAIRIGASDEDSPNPEEEVLDTIIKKTKKFGQAEIAQAVIILDGWDEVSLTGNVSYTAQLTNWLPKLREYFIKKRGIKVRVILTGRPSAEVSHSGVLRDTTPILTMRPIQPKQLKDYAQNIADKLANASPEQLEKAGWYLDLKAMSAVFSHYKSLCHGKRRGRLVSTGDILGNPLLAYLSFRVFSESKIAPEQLLQEPTFLYNQLIDITAANAGKGLSENIEGSAHRGGEKLRRLLHEVAATISLFRAESVSFNELQRRFDAEELPLPNKLLENWNEQADTGSALQELLINFYFKGGNKNLGCEFLHKSFREYLYAEAIFYSLKDAAKEHQGSYRAAKNYQYWEDFELNSPEYNLSRRLSYLLSPQWLTDEVRTHLFWLIEQDIEKQKTNWQWLREVLVAIYAWWAEGVLTRHQVTKRKSLKEWTPPYISELFEQITSYDDSDMPPIRLQVLDAHLGGALIQITAFVFGSFDELQYEPSVCERDNDFIAKPDASLRFNPGGKSFIRALAARIDSEGWRSHSGIGGFKLNKILLKGQDANFLVANGADLNGSYLCENNFSDSCFDGASMDEANIEVVDFDYASLHGASFIYSNLNGASFLDADLRMTDLRGATLKNTSLSGANIEGSSLQRANLEGADLSDAILEDADLEDVNLKNANLANANLKGANLKGANFEEANLVGADLQGADLEGANLEGVDLSVASTEGAIF